MFFHLLFCLLNANIYSFRSYFLTMWSSPFLKKVVIFFGFSYFVDFQAFFVLFLKWEPWLGFQKWRLKLQPPFNYSIVYLACQKRACRQEEILRGKQGWEGWLYPKSLCLVLREILPKNPLSWSNELLKFPINFQILILQRPELKMKRLKIVSSKFLACAIHQSL